MKILCLLLLISCGKNDEGRCYSKEEALVACQAEQMATLQVTLETAKIICEPYYNQGQCYRL
jgi:hypothetical protein